MPRSKFDIQSDIALANGGSVDAYECVYCNKNPNTKIKDIPLCNKCHKIFYLLIELNAI